MLYQIDLIYQTPKNRGTISHIAVKLHGAIMSMLDRDYAQRLHHNQYQPFSIHCVSQNDELTHIKVSVIDDSATAIIEAVKNSFEVDIYGAKTSLRLLEARYNAPVSAEQCMVTADRVCIKFNTPAIIKKVGKPACPPTAGAYFASVIGKYCFFEKVSIDNDKSKELCNLITELCSKTYSYSTEEYNISGNIFYGMVGHANIDLTKCKCDDEELRLIRTILGYGTYSGIGAKTALGMGGISITPI